MLSELANFRDNLTYYRVLRGYSQAQVSRRAGLDRATLSKIERDPSYTCNMTTGIILARVLGVTLADLLEDLPPARQAVVREDREIKIRQRRKSNATQARNKRERVGAGIHT